MSPAVCPTPTFGEGVGSTCDLAALLQENTMPKLLPLTLGKLCKPVVVVRCHLCCPRLLEHEIDPLQTPAPACCMTADAAGANKTVGFDCWAYCDLGNGVLLNCSFVSANSRGGVRAFLSPQAFAAQLYSQEKLTAGLQIQNAWDPLHGFQEKWLSSVAVCQHCAEATLATKASRVAELVLFGQS